MLGSDTIRNPSGQPHLRLGQRYSLVLPHKTDHLYSNVAYYESTMAHIQATCEAAAVFPCEFDAAVFVAADDEEWPENDDVF